MTVYVLLCIRVRVCVYLHEYASLSVAVGFAILLSIGKCLHMAVNILYVRIRVHTKAREECRKTSGLGSVWGSSETPAR